MDILYSGGAKGADTIFALCAEHEGHQIIAFSFPGHKISGPGKKRDLSVGELESYVDEVHAAGKALKRSFSKKPVDHPRWAYVRNLLLRDAWQIHGELGVGSTETVYAVGRLNAEKTGLEGGTGYGVQIAKAVGSIPIFVFDLATDHWHMLVEGEFAPCQQPPKPVGIYTGIGTRDLTDAGIEAIWALYGLDLSE